MRALLINLGSPEMDHLAAELARRGALAGLVRRYVNKGRPIERRLAALPHLGAIYADTLGRRLTPQGLMPADIIEQGVLSDFLFAGTARLSRVFPDLTATLGRRLLQRVQQQVALGAVHELANADAVVANYHVAGPVFREARRRGIPTVLNYPIAHHRFQYACYAERAIQDPALAAALPRFVDIPAHAALLDAEIELADHVLVGSSFVRQTFIEQGYPAHRISVVPYGADLERFTPPPTSRAADAPFTLICIGQLGERKGLGTLLRAYQQIRTADSRLQLIGDFAPGAEVYAPWQQIYEHRPHLPQAALPALLQGADVFVLPTLVEGMPMVVLEAMACGMPVVTTDRGPGEVVRDGVDGYLVPPGDTDALATRLRQLRDDPELRQRLGAQARERALQWPWRRYATQAADCVLEIAGRRSKA